MEILFAFLLDPVPASAAALALSLILVIGASYKLSDPALFVVAVDNYRLLPERLVAPVAQLTAAAELLAGLLLPFPKTRLFGGVLALALLAAVTSAVAINLRRGHTRIDCGCGGLSSQPLSWGLVARNSLLMALVLLAMRQGSGRALVWIDYLSIAGGTLALAGIYLLANQVMTNAAQALALRKDHS